jgi:prepilin peptidase CpaA
LSVDLGLTGIVPAIAFVALAGTAGLYDIWTRRIPNWLTLCMLVVALFLRAFAGLAPLSAGIGGAFCGLLVALALFKLGALGGGDGKLLIGVGAFLGYERLPGALLAIGVLGGLLGVLEAVRCGVILPAVVNAGNMIRRWFTLGRSGERRTLDSPGALAVPYGAAISAGAILWWFWGGAVQ